MKSKKVIVTKSFKGPLRYQYEETKSHITSLVGISASGNLLKPCSIIKRGSEHPDGNMCPYYDKILVYTRPNAFLTRRVFENYFNQVVFNYIQKVRQEINDAKAPTLIIYDGFKGHISGILFAKCSEENINIVMIPSHSSHLVQPLDEGVFRSMKSRITSVPK